MAILEYGIGGNDARVDPSEAIASIPQNRSLIIEHLTAEDPVNPRAITGLSTIEEVFSHFAPTIDIEFEDDEGGKITENFKFNCVADFGVKNMTENSPFMNHLNRQKEFYEMLMKQLRSNKVLQRVLEDAQAKEALITSLVALREELTNG
ncbi:MAG: hypothetical protein RR555_02315 [Bacteroidales bacterium]